MPGSTIPMVSFHFLQSCSLTGRTRLKHFISSLFRKEGKKLESLQVIFCSDEYLLSINRQYLQHDYFTDIITFDLSESREKITGELYISIDRIKDNAKNFDTSFRQELHRVIFHGILHLCGYKDKTPRDKKKMTDAENKYLSLYFS